MSVGSRLKILRDFHKLSQTDLANKLFKSKNCISAWEQGRNEIDISTLVELSSILNVSVDFLLNDRILETILDFSGPSYLQLKLLLKARNLDSQALNDILTIANIYNSYETR